MSKFREMVSTSDQAASSSIGDDIYTHVMGLERHGHVRGYGLGLMLTSAFGSSSSQHKAQQTDEIRDDDGDATYDVTKRHQRSAEETDED
ncbi:hypothetical protein HHK36_017622 [Tetracentron sinense]|uniref:Uncharacterized protein n=1 Tax=Tetracentron sinense TaxID=13715 RepID=A0A834YZY3_TETSI|nr:hypothetical protein HHK36_017622 [Tetracentron sinense]